MAKPSGATQAKRLRERARAERKEDKRAERELRKEQKKLDGAGRGEIKSWEDDPDLAGIVPGPQPIQD